MKDVLACTFFSCFVFLINATTGRKIPYEWSPWQMSCPDEKSLQIENPQVPWGLPFRAHRTVAKGFRLRRSNILKANLGIFSDYFVARSTWLGEYEGTPLPFCRNETVPCQLFPEGCAYGFKILRGEVITGIVDSEDPATSNWVRWINCARNTHEENVAARGCMGKVFYQTKKTVLPGQELLIYYGDAYAKSLGIYEEYMGSM